MGFRVYVSIAVLSEKTSNCFTSSLLYKGGTRGVPHGETQEVARAHAQARRRERVKGEKKDKRLTQQRGHDTSFCDQA